MIYEFFRVMVAFPEEETTRLNHYLKQHPINSVTREFVIDGEQSFWSFCVSYQENNTVTSVPGSRSTRTRVDYQAVLDPEQFAIFDQLRKLRNNIAREQGGIPAYAVFTNEQLAAMSQLQPGTISSTALSAIEGVGEKRLELYGRQFIDLLSQLND